MGTILKSVRWGRFLLAFLFVSILFGIGFYRMEIDTDIVNFLPRDDAVISDALNIFKNHPIQDRLFIDVSQQLNDLERLVAYGEQVEKMLGESGYFKTIGTEHFQTLLPELVSQVVDNLPYMFSERELENRVAPLLESAAVQNRFKKIRSTLSDLQGIGQAHLIEKDPLSLRDIVLSRMTPLAPTRKASLYKGKLISEDRKHLLVIAEQKSSGTDTRQSKKISGLIKDIEKKINGMSAGQKDRITITPVGGYRVALDNETIVRKDVERAILFATLGIAVLLIFAFPRPYMGLLALVPAIAGTMSAFFIVSLLHRSISIMVLGFGGAIISITVDHGIAYLLFLDRPFETSGKTASHEVWSIGLIAALTTVGAFGVLGFSGFPVFEQLGQFAAIGISISFVFVHTVFPLILPVMPPARARVLPLQKVVDRLALTGKKGAYAALVLFFILLAFARPVVDVSLNSMNTITRETAAAEKTIADVWGQFQGKVYLILEGSNPEELQIKGDMLLDQMEKEVSAGSVSGGFVPSMLFPGEKRSRKNLAAWKSFWNDERIRSLRKDFQDGSSKIGFVPNAFGPFFNMLEESKPAGRGLKIPEKYFGLMGITKNSENLRWFQAATFTIGNGYDPEKFYEKYKSAGKIFDPALFSNRLGKLLFSIFLKMLAIIGISVAFLIFLFFLDIQLTLYALIPVIFAFVCAMGTMRLMGHSIGIPEVILAVIIIGMGVDYSLFFVRSYQLYADFLHSNFGLVRMAVFMAAASTMIGFGVLCMSEHRLLAGAGWVSLLGIGYSFIGTFVILPPLLDRRFRERTLAPDRNETLTDRVRNRYRNNETYARMFARCKMLMDPMFKELPLLLAQTGTIRKIVDIGCGYGVPANWLLERFPEAMLYGFDPNPWRARVASLSAGRRAVIQVDRAPNVSNVEGPIDMVFMLDIVHYLNDEDFRLTLQRLYGILGSKGHLVIRAAVPSSHSFSFLWWIEHFKGKLYGIRFYYRSADEIEKFITKAGFEITHSRPSGTRGDLFWFVAGPGRNVAIGVNHSDRNMQKSDG